MTRAPSDIEVPDSMTALEAYSRIFYWFKRNNNHQKISGEDEYQKNSKALVNALPSYSSATNLEVRAILVEIRLGLLEWAYHETDGKYKMMGYAYAVLRELGETDFNLSEDERRELRSSRIWPYLTRRVR